MLCSNQDSALVSEICENKRAARDTRDTQDKREAKWILG
jgi:hypothetical protein